MAAQPLSKDDQLRAMRAMMAESKANENGTSRDGRQLIQS